MIGNQINSTRRTVRVGIIIGSIAVTLFAFQPNLYAQSSPLTVQPSTGRAGVGTTAPDQIFTIQTTGDAQISLKNPSGTSKGYIGTGGSFGSANTDDLRIRSDSSNIIFGFSGFETARFTSGGNVGIGSTAPAGKLHVEGSFYTAQGQIRLLPEDGALEGGSLLFQGAGTNRYFYIDNHAGALRLVTQDAAGESDKLFISNAGNVGLGTFNVTNILTVKQNSATDPIADAWTTYSSSRWKTNIQTITGAVNRVERLRGVSFDWKADGMHDIGLIAEEVGEVVPEVVAYEDNGKDAKSVDYARLVAVLIEAVKEQQNQIKGQQVRIEELSNRLQTLEGKAELAAAHTP